MSESMLTRLLVYFTLLSLAYCVDGPDNLGKEFIMPVLMNYLHNRRVEIFMTTPSIKVASVVVRLPVFQSSFERKVNVTRGQIKRVYVRGDIQGMRIGKAYKSVHVVSNLPIAVFCLNKVKYSTDAYLAYPLDVAGTDYIVMTYMYRPTFAVVGISNDTKVKIHFPEWRPRNRRISIRMGYLVYVDGDIMNVTLNRFQGFYCFTQGMVADLSGTHITSDKPVVVVGGNIVSHAPVRHRGTLSLTGGIKPKRRVGSSKDHMVEMMYPVACWGRKFFTFNTPGKTRGDILRILASEDDSVIKLTDKAGPHTLKLNARQNQDYDVPTGNLMTIQSNKAILVALFATTHSKVGDPSFTLLTSVPLYGADFTYSTLQTDTIDTEPFVHYITVIVHGGYTEGMRIDNGPMQAQWESIPGSGGYVIASIEVEEGSHTVFHVDPTEAFLLLATGLKSANSYAFPAGQKLTEINRECFKSKPVAGDLLDNDCDGSIDEEKADKKDDDGDGRVDEDLANLPRVNGMWGEWSEFSGCGEHVACNQERSRPCDNPAPANNGELCQGTRAEYLYCNHLPDCTTCLHGDHSNGNITCECHQNTTMGFWEGENCDRCMDGFAMRHCLNCDEGWFGKDHCSINCQNGATLGWDYDGVPDDEFIIPQVTCILRLSSSYMSVWLGYSSYNSGPVKINVGMKNNVIGSQVYSQEVLFRPGLHKYGFLAGPIRIGHSVTWILDNRYGGSNYSLPVPGNDTVLCPDGAEKFNLAEVYAGEIIGRCVCQPGYHGASCSNRCPGSKKNPCGGHPNVCSWRYGYCLCASRWTGGHYDYDLYTKGFVSKGVCVDCSRAFFGSDCSTAQLTRHSFGQDFYAVAFSSEIITLDGASLTLVQPGAYRLLKTRDITLDGFFVPCRGRYDCHSLVEVALRYNNMTFQYGVDQLGQTVANSSEPFDFSHPLEYESKGLVAKTAVKGVVRYTFKDGTNIVVANIQGELILGVTVAHETAYVTGLLGNADGHWVNDVIGETIPYSPEAVNEVKKATYAYKNFKLGPQNKTVLTPYNREHEFGSGGFVMRLKESSKGSVLSGLRPPSMAAFSLEFWAMSSEVNKKKISLITLGTTNGPLIMTFEDSMISVNWNKRKKTFNTMKLKKKTWTYIILNWQSDQGLLTCSQIPLSTKNGQYVAGQMTRESDKSYPEKEQTIKSIKIGGSGTNTDIHYEYMRLFSKRRQSEEIQSDFRHYTRRFRESQVLSVLFDEGQGSSFAVHANDGTVFTGHFADESVTWVPSPDIMQNLVLAENLPPIVLEDYAVSACSKELQQSRFQSNCLSFDAVIQAIMENCIKDLIRTNNSGIAKLSGSAFAYYCQGIARVAECQFAHYLDFCPFPPPNSGDSYFWLLLAVAFLVVMTSALCYYFACGKKRESAEEEKINEAEAEHSSENSVHESDWDDDEDVDGYKFAQGHPRTAASVVERSPGASLIHHRQGRQQSRAGTSQGSTHYSPSRKHSHFHSHSDRDSLHSHWYASSEGESSVHSESI